MMQIQDMVIDDLWRMSRAFAPVLAAQGGGAIVNVLSALSWLNLPGGSTYRIAKSAARGLSHVPRNELRAQCTPVLGRPVGFLDTELTAGVNAAKVSTDNVALQTPRALVAGYEAMLADATSREVKRGLSAEPGIYLQPAA
jgi:short-subunit dehydrogenase